MEATRTLLYLLINKLEGRNDSVCWALDQLGEDAQEYDPLRIEKQLQILGHYRCSQCHTLLPVAALKFSGGEDLCKECY